MAKDPSPPMGHAKKKLGSIEFPRPQGMFVTTSMVAKLTSTRGKSSMICVADSRGKPSEGDKPIRAMVQCKPTEQTAHSRSSHRSVAVHSWYDP